MSTEGWPGPMLPSPTPAPKSFARMSRAEILAWANTAYQAQNAVFVAELINTEDRVIAQDFGIADDLAARMKQAFAGLGSPRTA